MVVPPGVSRGAASLWRAASWQRHSAAALASLDVTRRVQVRSYALVRRARAAHTSMRGGGATVSAWHATS